MKVQETHESVKWYNDCFPYLQLHWVGNTQSESGMILFTPFPILYPSDNLFWNTEMVPKIIPSFPFLSLHLQILFMVVCQRHVFRGREEAGWEGN